MQMTAKQNAAVEVCALMIRNICRARPQTEWLDIIESRIRYMLNSQFSGASPAVHREAEHEPMAVLLREAIGLLKRVRLVHTGESRDPNGVERDVKDFLALYGTAPLTRASDAAAKPRCRACNGNDGDMPCAYPQGHPRCLRNDVAQPDERATCPTCGQNCAVPQADQRMSDARATPYHWRDTGPLERGEPS